jgi:hypothetical protein
MKSKKAAMEMSVGTIVTIVLLMSVLVLGIFLVQKIFSTSTSAIDQIDSQLTSEINKLFSSEGKRLVVYPSSRQITLTGGDDPSGFAFSVKNEDVEERDFSYVVEADPNFDFSRCGSSFRESEANGWILTSSGSFTLPKGEPLETPRLVIYDIPETAPPCTIPYNLEVEKQGEFYAQADIYITVE